MTTSNTGKIEILLKPQGNDNDGINYLVVKVAIGGLAGGLTGGLLHDVVLHREDKRLAGLCIKNVVTRDETGLVETNVRENEWRVERQTKGPVNIEYEVHPVSTWKHGFVALGAQILPALAMQEAEVSIAWDLSQDSRAVTSFGEGNVSTQCTVDKLSSSVFMVGNVHSHPSESSCEIHWLGELPENVDALKNFVVGMFGHLTNFFKDDTANYRLFLNAGEPTVHSLPSCSSCVIQYDDEIATSTEWEVIRLLQRNLVANWANLDPEADGTANHWFTEGKYHRIRHRF